MKSGTAISGLAIGPDDRWVWLPHARVMMKIVKIERGVVTLLHERSGKRSHINDFNEQVAKKSYVTLTNEEHRLFHYPEPLIPWQDF